MKLYIVLFCVALGCAGANGSASDAVGQGKDRCEVCLGSFNRKPRYAYTDVVRDVKRVVCKSCSDLKTVCWACRVPAHPKSLRRLEDDRVLCPLDAKDAVLTGEEARLRFGEVQREVLSALAHWRPRPETNFTVQLVNQDAFLREMRRNPIVEQPEHVLGMTRTERVGTHGYQHFVYLLSGMPHAQFKAVCAHEYTHGWLDERRSKARTLYPDTEEGFCEWMAWKYITGANQTVEAARILQSTYTHGQVNALVSAEKQFGFYRVVTWILDGVDSWLDKETPNRLLVLKGDVADPTPVAALQWPAAVSTAVPATLQLKGISAGRQERFALINDQTLAPNERARVRLGATNLLVKCIEIRDQSVVVEIEGRPERMVLAMSPAK